MRWPRFASTLLVVWLITLLMGCEPAKEETPEAEAEGGTEEPSGPSAELAAYEEEILAAMQKIADLINDNIDDADQVIAAVRDYVTKNEARFQEVGENARKLFNELDAETQEKHRAAFIDRKEFLAWDFAMQTFEEKHPVAKYEELDELISTVQNYGVEDDAIVDSENTEADPQVYYDQAEERFAALEAIKLADIPKPSATRSSKRLAPKPKKSKPSTRRSTRSP